MQRSSSRPSVGKTRGQSAAFTLVELLVVIGIIALLISVLLPALNRARMSAKSVNCMANLKEIGTTIQLYAHTYKGRLPPGFYKTFDPGDPGRDQFVVWPSLLQMTINPKIGINSYENYITNSNSSKLRKMFLCPEAPTDAMESGGVFACTYQSHPRLIPQIEKGGTLGWTQYDYYYGGAASRVPVAPYPLAKIRRSAEIIMIFDSPLQFETDSTTGVSGFRIAQNTPVANSIDKANYYSGPGYLVDNWAQNGLSAGDSIDLTAGFQGRATNRDNSENKQTVRFRHFKDTVANALMADGHVQSFRYDGKSKTYNPRMTDLLRRNVYVNASK